MERIATIDRSKTMNANAIGTAKDAINIITIDRLTEQELLELSRIRVEKWKNVLTKEHGDSVYQNSIEVLQSRRAICSELQKVRYNGTPLGAIHLLIVYSASEKFTEPIFKDHTTLTANGNYTTHNPTGNTIVCPEIYSIEKGGGPPLILDVLQLARKLKTESGIERMIAYTRPFLSKFFSENPGKTKEDYIKKTIDEVTRTEKYSDPFGMHIYLGARYVRYVENARPCDEETNGFIVIADYSHLLEH